MYKQAVKGGISNSQGSVDCIMCKTLKYTVNETDFDTFELGKC